MGGLSMNKLKCASFFAGVGGIDIGFENTGAFEVVYANELDPYPAKTFKLPSDMSNSRLYKQAGNSVCVSVIQRIAENIAIAAQII